MTPWRHRARASASSIRSNHTEQEWTELCNSIREKFDTQTLRRDQSYDKRFISNGVLKKVMNETRIESIITSLNREDDELSRFSNEVFTSLIEHPRYELRKFLAVLVYSGHTRSTVKQCICRVMGQSNLLEQVRFPLGDHLIDDLFPTMTDRATFRYVQQLFSVATIVEQKMVECPPGLRAPYESEELIGRGNFSKVYRVVVASHHFRGVDGALNEGTKRLARKDTELKPQAAAQGTEQEIFKKLLRSADHNNHIIGWHGSLVIDRTHSLFMPTADYDLETYMNEVKSRGPRSIPEKEDILEQLRGLSGGLAFLHGERNYGGVKFKYVHTDLKPGNILIVVTDDRQCWKISDFNIAQADQGQGDELVDFRKAVKESHYSFDTYSAPEATGSRSLYASSDVWSFACIYSVVLSWLDSGKDFIDAFSDLRGMEPTTGQLRDTGDTFFVGFSGRQYVNEAVGTWCKELSRRARRRDREARDSRHSEAAFVGKVCKMLLHEIFRIAPSNRITAHDVYRRLDTIGNLRRASEEVHSDAASSSASTHRPALSTIGRIFPGVHRHSRSRPPNPQDVWNLSLPRELSGAHAKRVVFGPDGDLVVIHSDRVLAAYSVADLCDTHDINRVIRLGEHESDAGEWRRIAVSRHHLVAATVNSVILTFRLKNPSTHHGKLEFLPHCSAKDTRVSLYAISPDSRYFAMLLVGSGMQEDRVVVVKNFGSISLSTVLQNHSPFHASFSIESKLSVQHLEISNTHLLCIVLEPTKFDKPYVEMRHCNLDTNMQLVIEKREKESKDLPNVAIFTCLILNPCRQTFAYVSHGTELRSVCPTADRQPGIHLVDNWQILKAMVAGRRNENMHLEWDDRTYFGVATNSRSASLYLVKLRIQSDDTVNVEELCELPSELGEDSNYVASLLVMPGMTDERRIVVAWSCGERRCPSCRRQRRSDMHIFRHELERRPH